jgi:hypothetical protein
MGNLLDCVIVHYDLFDISRWLQSQHPFHFQMFCNTENCHKTEDGEPSIILAVKTVKVNL